MRIRPTVDAMAVAALGLLALAAMAGGTSAKLHGDGALTGRIESAAVAVVLALLIAIVALDLSGHRLLVVTGASIGPSGA